MFEKLKAFFSEARSEFKKVSWPTWDEIKGSSAVVCTTIIILMVVLGLYDAIIAPIVTYIMKIK